MQRGGQRHRGRGEEAARERQQVWRERHAHRPARERRQLLLHLRGVAMQTADGVRLHVLVGLGVEVHRVDLAALGAGAAHARLAVDHDALEPRQPALEQGRRREDGADGIAAGRGDERGRRDRLAMQLRQSVDGLREAGRIDVGRLVPGRVVRGVVQAVVGREVDHLPALLAQDGYGLLRLHVRQREKRDVAHVRQPLGIELVESDVGEPAQVRIDRAKRLTGEPLGGHADNRHPRVHEQEPQQLGAHVAAGAGDRDADGGYAAHATACCTGISGGRPAGRTSSARARADRG